MKIQVNAAATVRNFGTVMSDKAKVLSELIQNARRAGASEINICVTEQGDGVCELVVSDDGVGIDDFSSLFTLSQSGWDESVAAGEGAFGMGFFSTLYAADEVLVQSRGRSLLIDSALARSMADFGEPNADSSAPAQGTIITLRRVKLSVDVVEGHIERLARYSRIPVSLNGEPCKRDRSFEVCAQNAKDVVETPFGTFVIRNQWRTGFLVVVQDLLVCEVYDHRSLTSEYNILYSDTLPCRMPDRDKLLDEFDTKKSIEAWLHSYYRSRLEAIRKDMDDDKAFLDEYYDQVVRFALDMLNSIDYLPAAAFQIMSYPTQRSDYDTDWFEHDTGIWCTDTFFAAHDADVMSEPVAANFLHLVKARIAKHNLPDGHWFNDKVQTVSETDFLVECEDAVRFAYSLDYIGGGEALVVTKARITHRPSGMSIEINKDAFATYADSWLSDDSSRATFVVDGEPSETPELLIHRCSLVYWGADLLLQLSSYQNEYDEYLDTELDMDDSSFRRQYLAAIGDSVESVLADLLGELPPALAQRLNGMDLRVSFQDGRAEFKALAA